MKVWVVTAEDPWDRVSWVVDVFDNEDKAYNSAMESPDCRDYQEFEVK